jgi:hypothetical protein
MNKVELTKMKTAWAMARIAELNAQGIENPVIVLPAFDDDGTIMDTAVTTTGTKGWGYIQLFQSTSTYDWMNGAMYEQNRWALMRANAATLEAKFKPGQNIGGNILVVDTLTPTNAANPQQDLRYTRREIYDMVEAGNTTAIPCKVNDKPVYRVRRWEPTGKEQDMVISHTNQVEIDEWFAKATKSLNTGNTAALQNAGKRALDAVA